jgi:hypothetical protein
MGRRPETPNTEYPIRAAHNGYPADQSEMVVLFTNVLTWLAWLFKPTQACLPTSGEPVLDTAGRLQQWTHLNTPLTSPHPRALNPLPEPALR